MEIQFQLQQQFQLLDEQEIEAVRLFIESLLQKRQKAAPKTAPKKPRRKPDFQKLKQISVPTTDFLLDRENIYADRSQFEGVH